MVGLVDDVIEDAHLSAHHPRIPQALGQQLEDVLLAVRQRLDERVGSIGEHGPGARPTVPSRPLGAGGGADNADERDAPSTPELSAAEALDLLEQAAEEERDVQGRRQERNRSRDPVVRQNW